MTTLARDGVTTPAGGHDTTYILKKTIETLENELHFADFQTPGELPVHSGSTARFTIDDLWASAGSTVTNAASTAGLHSGTQFESLIEDGVVGSTVSWERKGGDGGADEHQDAFTSQVIEEQIEAYGAFIPVRTQDLDQMPKSVMDRIGERLGYRGAWSKDTLLRAPIDGSLDTGSGASPIKGAGVTPVVTAATMTATDIANATGVLWQMDARPFSNGMYAAVISNVDAVNLATDVDVATLSWSDINKFVSGSNGQQKITNGNMGAILGTMIFRTNNLMEDTSGAAAAHFTNNIVLAKDAIGNVTQGDSNTQIFINKPDASSTDNPFRLIASVAFYFRCSTLLLDANRVVMLTTLKTGV